MQFTSYVPATDIIHTCKDRSILQCLDTRWVLRCMDGYSSGFSCCWWLAKLDLRRRWRWDGLSDLQATRWSSSRHWRVRRHRRRRGTGSGRGGPRRWWWPCGGPLLAAPPASSPGSCPACTGSSSCMHHIINSGTLRTNSKMDANQLYMHLYRR